MGTEERKPDTYKEEIKMERDFHRLVSEHNKTMWITKKQPKRLKVDTNQGVSLIRPTLGLSKLYHVVDHTKSLSTEKEGYNEILRPVEKKEIESDVFLHYKKNYI